MTKVFLSSVSAAIKPVREALLDALTKAGFSLINMETFAAQADRPLDVCLKELRQAELVVLVIGPRYGSLTLAGDVSFTHEEYREAQRRGIPVFAFVLPPDPGCDELERSRLEAFAKEVGQTAVYLASQMDRIPADVLASLMRAKQRGELGPRYSIFRPFTKHFAQELDANHGLHAGTGFFGREQELQRLSNFLGSTDSMMLMVAPGGSGKSRLLLEMARRSASGSAAEPRVLFVDGGATWAAEDINSLPSVSTVLVVDDAHRRPDLDRLIAASRQVNPGVRFIVSCRPAALEVVRPLLPEGTEAPGSTTELILTPLPKDAALQLAKAALGDRFSHLAEQLVRVADSNPLVVSVGGRCIAHEEIPPSLLDQESDEFRRRVLDRLLNDPALGSGTSNRRRTVLELVAALQPVSIDDDETRKAFAKHMGIPVSELVQNLGELERAGLLRRRGRQVRVTPDLLGDHLLFRSATDGNGKPTGFVEEVLNHFGYGAIGNVLANAAELDWKLSAGEDSGSVLRAIWRSLLDGIVDMPHGRRADLVKQLRRAAVFAPAEVLSICERVLETPQAPVDERLAGFGIIHDAAVSTEPACDLIGFIATHPSHTRRCIARLWSYALPEADPAAHGSKAIQRRIAQLLKYDANVASGVQQHVLEYVCERLVEPGNRSSLNWAIEAIGGSLEREGEANTSTNREYTFRPFSLASHYERIAPLRERAITTLTKLAMETRLDEAGVAIQQLAELVGRPEARFGREVLDNDLAIWLPEARRAANELASIAKNAGTTIIRYGAKRALRQALREHWPVMDAIVKELVASIPLVPEETFFDLLVGIPSSEQLDDWKQEDERVQAKCRDAAAELWSGQSTSIGVAAVVIELLEAAGSVYRLSAEDLWKLMGELVNTRPDRGGALAVALAESGVEEAMGLVPAVLFALVRNDRRDEAERLLREFVRSPYERLRVVLAWGLRQLLGGKNGTSSQLSVVQEYLRDESREVRQNAIYSLSRFSDIDARGALDLLMAIDWGNDSLTAQIVCDQLSANHALDPDGLTDDEVSALLGRIEKLNELGHDRNDVLDFVAYAAGRLPRATVNTLIHRVRASADHRGEHGEVQWQPIPHGGRGVDLASIKKSPELETLIRMTRDVVLDDNGMVRFWSPSLFGIVAQDFKTAEPSLREWLIMKDADRLVGAAHLLQGFDRQVLFDEAAFVADLLDAAEAVGGETLSGVRSELFSHSHSGVYGGTPGRPAQRHVDDQSASSEFVKQYASRAAVRQFYDDLRLSAQDWIARDMDRFAEMEDD